MLSYPNTTKYDKTSNTGGVIPGFMNNIAFNSGVRTFAKLCLISLWGKFCERCDDRIEKKFLDGDTKTFYDSLSNPKYNVSDIAFLDNDVCIVYYSRKEGYNESARCPMLG